MKKIILFLIYTLLILFIGKQISIIPQINFKTDVKKTEDFKKNVLLKFLNAEKGNYSIFFKDLKTNTSFGVNENQVLTGASLNKLVIIAYLYSLAEKGKIDLEDKISVQKEDIQDYGTGSLRYQEPGQSYSLRTLAKLSLEKSDNTAAYVLSIKLGQDNIQQYAKQLNLSATNMVNNKTSAKDMGELISLLYQGKIAKDPLRSEIADYMKDTDFEDRIPRDFGENVDVYHKTGDSVGMIHDVAVVDDKKSMFVLSILTSDMNDVEYAKKTIGKIAKFIYDERNK